MTNEPILITVTGKDRAGITAEITGILADGGAQLLDVEQVVVGPILSLSFVVQLAEQSKSTLKDLLFKARELGIELDFQVFTDGSAAVPRPKVRYALTLLAPELTPRALSATSGAVARLGWNIDRITRLSESPVSCLELVLSGPSDLAPQALRDELLGVSKSLGLDIALQREGLLRRVKRLVVLDMDSTLIQQEIIDELAQLHGAGAEVAAITARAMAGELPFREALRQRVALLKGAPESIFDQVLARIQLTPGAETLCQVLKRLGYRLAVISGGFQQVTDVIRAHLGLDYGFSNRLEVLDGHLTGELAGPIVDAQRKADLLESLAQQEGIGLDQVIAVGDGANDLPMLRHAGLGVAFNAKPRVQAEAGAAINQRSLISVLHLLGMHGQELRELETRTQRQRRLGA
jgi:phosphoserine phosphatase